MAEVLVDLSSLNNTCIIPSTDMTWTNGDAGNWSNMHITVNKVQHSWGYHELMEQRWVPWDRRESNVSFNSNLHRPGWGYDNNIGVDLYYTNPLIPEVYKVKYITAAGQLYTRF